MNKYINSTEKLEEGLLRIFDFLRRIHIWGRFKKWLFGSNVFAVFFIFLCITAFAAIPAYYDLLKRVETIEKALGGQQKLKCSRQETIAKVAPSIVRIIGGEGEGSGFVFKKGYVLTNYHVIADEPSPKIVYSDNKFETGAVLAVDPDSDLAIIAVLRSDIEPLAWAYEELQAGDEVLATGFPLGGDLNGELTVNATNLAGKRSLDVNGRPTFIQLDGGLVSGMSGGPVLTRCGDVVGVNESTLGRGAIGLAIAGNHAQEIIDSMFVNPSSNEDLIAKIVFELDKSPTDTVRAYYNYLKVRNFQEAYNLLSSYFIGDVSYQDWRDGFSFSLDSTILSLTVDRRNPQRVLIELGSTDLIEGEFVYRVFKGAWLVKSVNGHLKMWESNIKEIEQ